VYREIVAGYDGSVRGRDAIALAGVLAGATGARLVVAGVFRLDPIWGAGDPASRDAEAAYAREIESAADAAGAEAAAIPSSSPARGLHELAEETGADLVVVGSARHGRAGHVLPGNVGLSLLHGAPCSVAVAPRGWAGRTSGRIEEVTLGYDGSEESRGALREAADLARAAGAPLRVVSAAPPPALSFGKGGGGSDPAWQELADAIAETMRGHLDEALAAVPDGVRAEGSVVAGDPAAALAGAAVPDRGVLVLGSRGYGPLRRVLLGSVSAALVRGAPCPVIVHPRTAAPETAPAPAGAGGAG
jgi:nucleotide-binding universal stress UspA family protein